MEVEKPSHSPDITSRASASSAEKAPATLQGPSTIDEKALLRKIDIRVIPILFIIYLAAFLDRVNIANALTLRLPKDLHLKGNESNVALTIFFVPYVLFEVPSNILMKRFKPHVWLSGCILAFGIVMLCQGFVQSYSGLLATRFFLGLAEAGVFPGCFYLISFWYKREESQRRFTVFWSSVLFASMFGGLLASAIANMQGVRGYSSWRWIFILEGIATIIIGIGAYFLVADFPADASWLSAEEKEFVIARTGTDEGAAPPITVRQIVSFFGNVKNIIGGFMYFAVIVPIYSYSYFAPTIVKTLGYSTVETQLHTVPPAAAALALCLLSAYLSDRLRLRFPFIFFGFLLTIVGLAILLTTHGGFHLRYLGICFVAMGCFSAGPIIVCWYVMNLNGHMERSIGSAWMIGFGNTGGFVATFCFLAKDAPFYHIGYSICMGATCIGALAVVLYAGLVILENNAARKRDGKEHANKMYL
ncbi:hypothetical protein HO173_005040 [Letharia columbiana]|uniref:Major facilitator superfamily (MFS) profile domain-containing protein n=1 Tax=Letharia columbiana TaxID=112416 RepID=A0A8H6FXM8_9LECA|nr:uncharacterized protein HO173_005040 [Letharia columbiana]KAF6236749.1 hypothetical protein HO173_005040 [Letharia columbiana]